jgi:putative addiction module component (TIGR02574 family)
MVTRYLLTMTDAPTSALTQLPVDERLRLIEELWDSLDAEIEALPTPQWQRDELEKRLDALDDSTSVGAPWAVVKQRILSKR